MLFLPHKIVRLLYFLLLPVLLASTPVTNVWAHAGHSHDASEPQVKLPNVLAKVNDTSISKDSIWPDLKKTVELYKEKGVPLNVDQEKVAAKKLVEGEIRKILLLEEGKGLGIDTEGALDDKAKLNDVLQQVIAKKVSPRVTISNAEVADYYKKNKGKFQERVRASVILLKVKPKDSDSERKALKKMESIVDQINRGAKFGELAKKFSQDSLRSRGGDLGFLPKNRMLPEFAEWAFKLKPGETSEIFRSSHGLHLLQVTDYKDAQSVEEARESIRGYLKKKKVRQETRVFTDSLKTNAKVTIYF